MSKPVFTVRVPEVELTVKQIWPDGDAPKDPTVDDVLAEMQKYGTFLDVLGDWRLVESLDVFNGAKRASWQA